MVKQHLAFVLPDFTALQNLSESWTKEKHNILPKVTVEYKIGETIKIKTGRPVALGPR